MSLKQFDELEILGGTLANNSGRSQFIHQQMNGSSSIRLYLRMLCYLSATWKSAHSAPTDDQWDGPYPACHTLLRRLEVTVRKWVEPEELN